MASQSTIAVTKECHTKERAQEEVQVHPHRKPLSVKVIGLRIALAQEEERVDKYRWTLLRVVTPTANVDQSRGVLTDGSIRVHDCRTKSSRRSRQRKTQPRRELTAEVHYLIESRGYCAQDD